MSHTPSRLLARVILVVAIAVGLLLVPALDARAQQPEPYRDPPFSCEVIDFGSDPPPVPGPTEDPLCVRYDKTNATISDLQVLDFLAAEPGRVGLIAVPPRCAYWQQDHWVVRLDPALPPLVSWRGSYWYDASTAGGGAVMRDLQVAGVPVAADAFVDAIAPLIGPEQAEALRAYTDAGGGGGVSVVLPDGVGLGCRADQAPSDAPPEPPPAVDSTTTRGPDTVAVGSSSAQSASDPGRLPATGGHRALVVPAALSVAGLLSRRALIRWRYGA